MRRQLRWVVLWSLWASALLPPAPPPLRLRCGALRGRVARDGGHVAYRGVPYARVERRFQAARAVAWRGVLDAVDEHARCAQRFGPLVVGDEDCLRLNVYAPTDARGPRPVMVFIHGGGFFEGSGGRLLYGPEYLVRRGVVLVTFNYRLAAPGFLCLGTAATPGNAGLKDQVAALRWVRDHIAAFGGDPDNVTIFGESAGAAAVSLHLVSPMSRGLFHRAVAQSGSSLAPWALTRSLARARAAAAELASALGSRAPAGDLAALADFLANATVAELLSDPTPRKAGRVLLEHMPYVPCIEERIDGVEAFLTESPFDILASGRHNAVPTIIGVTDQEGYFFTAMEDDATLFASGFEDKLPAGLSFPAGRGRRRAARALRRLYPGAEAARASARAVLQLSRFYGDAYFAYPARAEAALLAARAGPATPVYVYVMAHAGWRNLAKLSCGPRYWGARGATHADDLFYLFRVFPLPAWPGADLVDTFTRLWTEFAEHGVAGAVGAVPWPALTGGVGGAAARVGGAAARVGGAAARVGGAAARVGGAAARVGGAAARVGGAAARVGGAAARVGGASARVGGAAARVGGAAARVGGAAARVGGAAARVGGAALWLEARPRVAPLWHSGALRYWRRLYRRYGAAATNDFHNATVRLLS